MNTKSDDFDVHALFKYRERILDYIDIIIKIIEQEHLRGKKNV